ncbi:MAG: MFS transporter [Methanoregula sp.]
MVQTPHNPDDGFLTPKNYRPAISLKYSVLIVVVLVAFLVHFDLSAVNIALPAIGSEFHMDAVSLSWVSTAYLLSTIVFLVPFGKLADIWGRKRIFFTGIGVFTGASFLLLLVFQAPLLILLRAVQGIGSAMIFATSTAILISVCEEGERGRMLGIYITAVYLGLSTGPFLGGVLTQVLGWKYIFLVNVPIGIAALLLLHARLHREWTECADEPFDLPGAVIYGATLVSGVVGLSLLPDIAGCALVALGLCGAAAFYVVERKTERPVFDLSLLTSNRVFARSSLTSLICYSATFAVAFLMSLELQIVGNFTPVHAGMILLVQPLMQAIVSPFTGRLSDRVEPGIVVSFGMGLVAVGLFLLIFVGSTTPVWYIVCALALLGVGFGFFASPNENAIMSSVERCFYGVAAGTLSTVRLMGQVFSMAIAALLFSLIIGRTEITADSSDAFLVCLHILFALFTVLCIFGMVVSLKRGNLRP